MTDLINLPKPENYRFYFQFQDEVSLPAYTGSTWRGLLGHGLKKLSCITQAKKCDHCVLLDHCVYGQLFESTASSGPSRFRNRPHPFVLNIDPRSNRQFLAGEKAILGLTLFGQANAELPYLVQAWQIAGQLGIGRYHVPFQLYQVEQEQHLGDQQWTLIFDQKKLQSFQSDSINIPPAPDQIDIILLTPLRIKRDGRLLGAKEFKAADFLNQLKRRIQNLAHFYGQNESIQIALPSQPADTINADARSDLHWFDWTRKSSRQRQMMKMGGLIGRIQMQGPVLADWWPMIWIGQWLHLGKATSMGLGHYIAHPA